MSFDGPLIGGRWKLGPRVGGGAQGELYLAQDLEKSARNSQLEPVVIKRFTPRGTWKSFELFEREAKVLSQLRHAGVPRYLATVEEPPGTFNLVMERAPGIDLRALQKRRRLSETELRDIMMRTLEILDYLHSRTPAVVHRDIKPSNILRAPDGKISLVDFGGVLDAARDHGGSTIVGTYGYMAPEQLHGRATAATDIYALGATVVSLAGGIEPEDVPRKGLTMDLVKHLPNMDLGLRAALAAMCDPDPDKRPQRAKDVAKLLARRLPAAFESSASSSRSDDGSGPLARRGSGAIAPRRLFSDVAEPLGTLLRFAVLGFGAGGWLGMAGLRLGVTIAMVVVGVLAFPARRKVVHVSRELDAMLAEGQGGFTDMMRSAMARR